VLFLRPEAGSRPGGRGTCSLLRQRKVPKRKATHSLRPLRCAKGQTCVGAVAGCAAELTTRLRRSVRTTAASQFTKHGRCDAHATPQPPRRRRSQQGWDSRTAEQSTRAIAALGLAVAARSACAIQAERSDGPWGCPVAGSLLCVPRSAGQGVRACAAGHTHFVH